MDWQPNSTPILKELDPSECEKIVRNLSGRDSPEMKQCFHNVLSSPWVSFQIQFQKKGTPFTVSKLNTVNTGVFT